MGQSAHKLRLHVSDPLVSFVSSVRSVSVERISRIHTWSPLNRPPSPSSALAMTRTLAVSVLLLAFCCSCSLLASAQDIPCTWTSPDGSYFDFSSLTDQSGIGVRIPLQGVGPLDDVYYINVCAVAAGSDPTCKNDDATLCWAGPEQIWYPLAKNEVAVPPNWSLIAPGDPSQGVLVTYANGVYGTNPVEVKMSFTCNPNSGTATYTARHADVNTFVATISAQACCATTPPSSGGKKGLSGGWIFVILLLVFFTVYIIAGCAYKHYRVGTQGMESCPNVDFWRELPGLIKDGCVWSWTKARACCGGSGGGGGNEYTAFK